MTAGRRREAGYSMVALMVTITVMMVMMAAAVPSWRYLIRNDREEELIFRGGEIADAIARFQRKNGNALPPSLEILVKGKYLRKEYKDPMSKDGKWRFIRQGETVAPGAPGIPGLPGGPGQTTTTTTRPSQPGPGTVGGLLGGIFGVASTSTEKSLRVFNGRTKYNEWLFIPGQPRIIGRQAGLPTVIGPGGVPAPGKPPVTGGPQPK